MHTLSLPFSGRTPISRHRSAEAAQQASATRATKTLRYLQLLKEAGEDGLSDHEAAKATGWALSSINSIRNGCGILAVPGERVAVSPWGRKTTTWKRR